MEKFLKFQYLSHLGLKTTKPPPSNTTLIERVYRAMIPKSYSKFPRFKFFLEDFI